MQVTKGFTLIEIVVYLALFAIFMSGLVMSLYAVEQSAGARTAAANTATEAEFIEEKMAYEVEQTGSMAGFAFDPGARTIVLHGEPLTSADVTAFTVSAMGNAYNVLFTINGVQLSDRYYAP